MKPPVILVIRGNDRFSEILREAGIEVRNLELVKTQPVSDLADLKKKLDRLPEYDGLFFTSPAAAEVFVAQARQPNSYPGKIYALGERAKMILENAGFPVIYHDSANSAEELLASFENSEFDAKRFLFVRGDKSMRTIPDRLSGRAVVDESIAYETRNISPTETEISGLTTEINSGRIDWICFFSPSGVAGFSEVFRDRNLKSPKAVAIGKTTAQKARESGFNVQFISNRSNADDFARGLIKHIKDIE
jgi:uroporphyrinogen-III synthase